MEQEGDRGEKLAHYKQIPSLQAVLLFNYRMTLVEVWQRTDVGWTAQTFGAGATIEIEAIGCSLRVDDVYAAAQNA